MKLHINENNITDCSIHYPEWTQMYFVQANNSLKPNLSEESEKTSPAIKKRIVSNLTEGYVRLKARFDVEIVQMDDEYDTLVRMIDIMPYGEYRQFASLVIAPYQHLEYDDDSLKRLEELGYDA